MYSPDTLRRLNNEAVAKYQEQAEEQAETIMAEADRQGVLVDELASEAILDLFTGSGGILECDYCEMPATFAIPVYNPADAVRVPPVEGAYELVHVCNEHWADDTFMEERFYCDECGELFAYNHSWDVLAVTDPESGEMFCQKCYAEHHLEPVSLGELQERLAAGETSGWLRLNSVPGKRLLVELGVSSCSDFPGCHTSKCVGDELQEAAEAAGLGLETAVYPVVTAGRQFHVEVGVYY
jgi:hypothetical protein